MMSTNIHSRRHIMCVRNLVSNTLQKTQRICDGETARDPVPVVAPGTPESRWILEKMERTMLCTAILASWRALPLPCRSLQIGAESCDPSELATLEAGDSGSVSRSWAPTCSLDTLLIYFTKPTLISKSNGQVLG